MSARGSRPTMADVARAAGVSPTTVSHALNGKGRVDDATRAHVRETARRLGYAPSRAARGLALGRSETLGLLLPRLADVPATELLAADWYGRVAIAATQAALDHGRALSLLPWVERVEDLRRYGLEGAILLDPVAGDPRGGLLDDGGVPYVVLGRDDARPDAWSVAPDTVGGTTALLDHLAERGARSVALLATEIDWSAGRDAIAAYRAWAGARGREPRVAVVSLHPGTEAARTARAGAVARELLAGDDRPDAIVGLFEDFGGAIVDAARGLGLDVPGDLLVAQDVDGPKAQLNRPPITALDLDASGQVAEAIGLLVARLDGAVAGGEPVHRTTAVRLCRRASTGG